MDTDIRYLQRLEDDLADAADREGSRKRRGGEPKGDRPHRSRDRWRFATAAAALLILAGSIGWFTQNHEVRLSPMSAAGESAPRSVAEGGAPGTQHNPVPGATYAPILGGRAPAAIPSAAPDTQRLLEPASKSADLSFGADSIRGQGNQSAGGVNTPSVDLQKIERTGAVSTVVPRNGLQDATVKVASIADRFGGMVFSETIGTRLGTMVVQVPSHKFDETMSALKAPDVGRVVRASVQGQNVTANFVDLQARLTIAQGRLKVLTGLYAKTSTIEGTLRIESALEQTQLQIEQLKGQIRVINSKSSNATIRVDLREAGTVVPLKPDGSTVKNPSLGSAWDHAVQGFLGVISAILIGLGYLLPLLVVAGVVVVIRRARTRPATS
jgi:hypothetical protein